MEYHARLRRRGVSLSQKGEKGGSLSRARNQEPGRGGLDADRGIEHWDQIDRHLIPKDRFI